MYRQYKNILQLAMSSLLNLLNNIAHKMNIYIWSIVTKHHDVTYKLGEKT